MAKGTERNGKTRRALKEGKKGPEIRPRLCILGVGPGQDCPSHQSRSSELSVNLVRVIDQDG